MAKRQIKITTKDGKQHFGNTFEGPASWDRVLEALQVVAHIDEPITLIEPVTLSEEEE